MPKNSEEKAKKKEIIKNYNLTSEFYDRRYSDIQKQKFSLILKDLILNQKILLDTGCGTGLLLKNVLEWRQQRESFRFHYVGVDISINMLNNFQRKLLKNTNLRNVNINLVLSDIEHLPIRNNIFDLIFSITALQNLPDINKGLKETIRVAKTGAFVNLSILKKKLNLKKLIGKFKSLMINTKIINIESIEDLILIGEILKE
ncbi:MAG: class I SAM-dependent methyltransferase [Candidatus Hermodarchaeota archaeon]